MITRRTALMGAAFAATAPVIMASKAAEASETMTPVGEKIDLSKLPRRKVNLVPPPFVHEHDQIAKSEPAVVEFEMTIVEKKIEIDEDGTMLQGMTFEGSIPGPLMVVHEGDYVELTLVNPPENTMQHNIDFHAATGGLGGGSLTLVNPGERTILRFKATRPGTFLFRASGQFSNELGLTDAPKVGTRFQTPFYIMKHQVSEAAYNDCARVGVCGSTYKNISNRQDFPVTGISYKDASDYANWLSGQTGILWCLPTDVEWAYAAGSRFVDDAIGLGKAAGALSAFRLCI